MTTSNLLVYRALAGSQLYGTASPDSDTDWVEVYLPSRESIFGIDDKWGRYKQDTGEESDVSRFGINQFMKLLGKGNPNVLETCFCPTNRIEHLNVAFSTLISGDEQTMTGLAAILNKTSVVKAHLGFAIQQVNKMMPSKAKWTGPRREALFKKYGYDVKYAAHAVRLTYQCEQLLSKGYIEYPYPPFIVKMLASIRAGEKTLKEVRDWFNSGLTLVQELEKTQCAITDEDKRPEINRRLIRFYEEVGYAAIKFY